MPYKDIEKRRAAARKGQAKYRRTTKGIAANVAFWSSPAGKETRRKENAKSTSRLARARVKKTPKSVIKRIAYDATSKRKAARDTYRKTSRGRAVFAAKTARRKSLKLATPGGNFTATEFEALCADYDYRCAYCFSKPAKLTADHVTALTKGGSNEISNIVPACLGCNSSKMR